MNTTEQMRIVFLALAAGVAGMIIGYVRLCMIARGTFTDPSISFFNGYTLLHALPGAGVGLIIGIFFVIASRKK